MSKDMENGSIDLEQDQVLENQQAVADTHEAAEQGELPEVIEINRDDFIKIKEHIASLEKERDEMKGLAQRVQADFDNYRRRNATISTDCREEGVRNVISNLLPVLDNFDRALENADGVNDAWLEGIKLVYRQLMETLGKCGLSEVPADGVFDPNLHNAVMQEESEGACAGSILEVFQKGYQVNERIVRHSMVKVAQ